jgi:hypothetical protein
VLNLSMNWWHFIVDYYKTIGERYNVNPVIFLGIHIVATPVFAITVSWIVYCKRKKQSLALPIFAAILVFNAANIYLILFGKGLSWWIYAFVATTTLVSGFFTVRMVRNRITKS